MMWPVMAVLGVATSVFLLISLHVKDWNRSGGRRNSRLRYIAPRVGEVEPACI